MLFSNNKRLLTTSIGIGFLSLSTLGHAIEDEQNTIENVIVIGESKTKTTNSLAGAYDVIGRDELYYEHRDDTYELFDKAPGVYIARYNQGIINTDVAIRGFAGDGVTPHTKLLIDDIPFNLNNGYGELDQLFPLDIERIELYKGTSDARYGLFNLAGNYNIASRRDIAKDIKLTLGSYDTTELQGYAGLESGDLTQNYFIGYRQGNGYRDHTDIEKLEASGKWFYQLDDTSEIGFSLRHSTYEADSPGYFNSQTEARSNPRSSAPYSSEDGGDKTINHYSLHYNKTLSNFVDWSVKTYYNDIQRNRWVRFFETSALQNRVDNQQQTGLITTFDWIIDEQWSVNFGADIEQQDVAEQRFNHPGQTRNSLADPNRDREYTLDTTGAFVSLEQKLSDLLRWNIGVRLDNLDGNFTDNISDNNATIFDFDTIVQPKVNIFITPNDSLLVFANYGRSFQHPYGSQMYANLDVSEHNAWELGSKWLTNDNVELRLSYWNHKGSDEFLDLDGFLQIIGDTERDGFDLSANATLSNAVSIWFNYSLLNSEITAPQNVVARPANANTKSNELRSIPTHTASVGINYQINSKLYSRLHIDNQGDYYINENNQGGKFGDFTLVSIGFDYMTNWGSINLQINNLFDQYYEYVYDFGNTGAFNIYSPGDGTNASLSFSWEL